MVTEKQVEADNWFDEYDKPKEKGDYPELPIFEMKLKENQIARTEKVIFLSEGKKAKTRFGETIIFNIVHDGVDKVWFIKRTQYNLLNPIAAQKKKGSLEGKTAEVQRAGQGATETKWSIIFK